VAAASVASPSVLVEVNAPGTLPAIAEPEALRGAVRFLVDEACRRTEGGNLVTVKTGRVAEGVTVHVIDRGAGADREQPSLDLARSLVSIHGGILWAEPLPAGGTKVSFTIPEEPPALEGPQLEAASEAMRQLAESAVMAPAAVAVLEPEVEVDLLEEAQAEAARALELAVLADLAAAEAPAGIEELTAPPALPEVEEVIELEAPDVDVELQPLEAEAFFEPEPEPEPETEIEAFVEPEPEIEAFVEPEPEPELEHETEIEALVEAPAEPVVEAEVEAPAEPVVEAFVEPEPEAEIEAVVEAPSVAHVPPEVVEEIQEPIEFEEAIPPAAEVPMTPVQPDPEPVVEPAPESVVEPTAEPAMPPRTFIPDPLHPATQMLRGLALDFDPDADDVPRWYRG
jgi:hypothetical protein